MTGTHPNVLQRRRLGRDGPEITTIGFGSWAIGGPYLFGWGPVDDEESIAALRYAVENGVNWVDTAPIYGLGHSEEIVGEALRPWTAGEEVLVFTKCGRPWLEDKGEIGFDLRPDSIRDECEQSLKRLGVERIDLYQIHWPDPVTGTQIEDSWQTMVELVEQGKARWIGVSNFDVELLERCESLRHVDSLQPPLSLIRREARRELVPWCRDHGTGVIAYAPLANGLLSGKFDRKSINELAADDWRQRAAHFTEPKLTQNLALVERLQKIGEDLGVRLIVLGISWVLAQPGVTAAAVGARRPDQVDGWLPASGVRLEEDAMREIERAVRETGAGEE
jgi:aryl-alcohol dehydrogenase-like predicted oxidoreductase